MAGFDSTLLAKPIQELTPQELASVNSYLSEIQNAVTARQTELKKTLESEEFGKILKQYKASMLAMSWAKFPKVGIFPNADGSDAEVKYISTEAKKGKGTGKRSAPDVNSGDITINKIITTMGAVAMFETGGKQYEGQKELIHALMQPGPDGKPTTTPESERCWDTTTSPKHGISLSDLVIKYHGDEVKLIFADKTEMTVTEAVAKMKAGRAAAAAAA